VYIFVDAVFPEDVRSSAQGLFNLLILGIGNVVASFLFPTLIGKWTGPGGVVDYQTLFLVPTGMALVAMLLLALLWVNMVSGYAKAIVVLEERRSAALALLSAFTFALARPLRTFGHYLALAALGVALLLIWGVVDGFWSAAGYVSQIVTFVMAQGLVAARIALRLALWAGQLAMLRRFAAAPAPALPATPPAPPPPASGAVATA